MRTAFLISGMKDSRCRQLVTDAVEAHPGVREVYVNLYRARAMVTHDDACTPEDLIRAIALAGYGATVEQIPGVSKG